MPLRDLLSRLGHGAEPDAAPRDGAVYIDDDREEKTMRMMLCTRMHGGIWRFDNVGCAAYGETGLASALSGWLGGEGGRYRDVVYRCPEDIPGLLPADFPCRSVPSCRYFVRGPRDGRWYGPGAYIADTAPGFAFSIRDEGDFGFLEKEAPRSTLRFAGAYLENPEHAELQEATLDIVHALIDFDGMGIGFRGIDSHLGAGGDDPSRIACVDSGGTLHLVEVTAAWLSPELLVSDWTEPFAPSVRRRCEAALDELLAVHPELSGRPVTYDLVSVDTDPTGHVSVGLTLSREDEPYLRVPD